MSFKTKLALAVLASEKISIEPLQQGVLLPVTKTSLTQGDTISFETDTVVHIEAKGEQEIWVSGTGVATFKDKDGNLHDAEFEARGSLVPLREEHIVAVSP